MIVVADSSPLHYLILLEQTELLRRLYGEVLIPDTVAAELRAPASPPAVSEWLFIRSFFDAEIDSYQAPRISVAWEVYGIANAAPTYEA